MSDLTSADFSSSVVAALALVLHAQFLLMSVAEAAVAEAITKTLPIINVEIFITLSLSLSIKKECTLAQKIVLL
ncbi:hypothetical protein [Legionella feeleii]|uniref:hypothetical protein n=1 Tax=Legionella feeleii TaxID=453 RepID=UPI0012E3EAEF|nr:hypothetical protein [Legionella feeleii]